jgi:hypothetical protein
MFDRMAGIFTGLVKAIPLQGKGKLERDYMFKRFE